MMEFEELKKIWNVQNQKPLYVINENELHNRIRTKKNKSQRLANLTEYVFIGATIFSGSIILFKEFFFVEYLNNYKLVIAAFFYAITAYVFYRRSLRKNEEQLFEKTMMEDLKHALSNASHQTKLSSTMMKFVLPVVSIIATATEWISSGFSLVIPAIILFFLLTYYAARWEHRCYMSKLRELQNLESSLLDDPVQ